MKKFLLIAIFAPVAIAVIACAPAPPTSALKPTDAPAVKPTATGACAVRLSTTTSTADSGLLAFILPDFAKKFNCKVDVIAVGTGQAIQIGQKGDADVLLVHDRAREDQFVKDGNTKERFDVMYNDFIVVGPKNDPAKITGMTRGTDALKAIANAQATFMSRGDGSGTHAAEMRIWASVNISLTKEIAWYNALGQGMGETLLSSNEKDAYTIADRGTWLSMMGKLPNLVVLVGGNDISQNKDAALFNPYGLMAVNPDKFKGVNTEKANEFVKWMRSVETQKMIGSYTDKTGQILFYPNARQ